MRIRLTLLQTLCTGAFLVLVLTISAQTTPFDVDAVHDEFVRIAEQSRQPGASKGLIAIQFANYYNKVVAEHSGKHMEIVEIMGKVARAYDIGYSIKNRVMETAHFKSGEADAQEKPPPLPPKLDKPSEKPAQIFKVIERMPRFPGCEDYSDREQDKYDCSQKELLTFIYKNLKYPEEARKNGIQGRVIIQYKVGKDGILKDFKVKESLDPECDAEALRVAMLMNEMEERWIPGVQKGQPVEVQFSLPMSFRLQKRK